MLPALVIDLVVPLVVYGVLSLGELPATWSLAGAAAVPGVRIAVRAVRRRRMNGLAFFVLCSLIAGVILTLLTGNARLAIAREAVITVVLGAVLIGSLATRRPATYYLIRSLRGPDVEAQWQQLPSLRRDLRSLTAVIGALCLLDAALRVLIAYTLPLHSAGTLVHLLPIALVACLAVLGKSWGRRIRGYAEPANPEDQELS